MSKFSPIGEYKPYLPFDTPGKKLDVDGDDSASQDLTFNTLQDNSIKFEGNIEFKGNNTSCTLDEIVSTQEELKNYLDTIREALNNNTCFQCESNKLHTAKQNKRFDELKQEYQKLSASYEELKEKHAHLAEMYVKEHNRRTHLEKVLSTDRMTSLEIGD